MYTKELVGNEQIEFEEDDEGALLRVALNFKSADKTTAEQSAKG